MGYALNACTAHLSTSELWALKQCKYLLGGVVNDFDSQPGNIVSTITVDELNTECDPEDEDNVQTSCPAATHYASHKIGRLWHPSDHRGHGHAHDAVLRCAVPRGDACLERGARGAIPNGVRPHKV